MQRIKKRQEIWDYLQQIIPLNLAGSWDNVGILLDPAPIHQGEERIFLTIDLTEAVLEEALDWNASIIIAYHPPIFGGLKRLSIHHTQSNVLVRAIQAGIGIYSPHSALDAVSGGMCDWLASIFSSAFLNQEFTRIFTDDLPGIINKKPLEVSADNPMEGAGRFITFQNPVPLSQLLPHLSQALSTDYFRIALPYHKSYDNLMVQNVALCPGAGASLFHANIGADLLFTGEMRHHDVLSHVRRDRAVVLTEHTRCERGYLPIFAQRLQEELSLAVKYSTIDHDPLQIWQSIE